MSGRWVCWQRGDRPPLWFPSPHPTPRRGKKDIKNRPKYKARRWVVELTHSWFNRFRKLLPRYKKTDRSYYALTALAAAMITLNKVIAIYG